MGEAAPTLSARPMSDWPTLSAAEVVIIRGWYAWHSLDDIAERVGVSRNAVARQIRAMRERGLVITERPKNWHRRGAQEADLG